MRRPFLAFFIILHISSIQAQTLVKIGTKEITVPEFLWAYNKSNGTPPSFDAKSIKEYLDLYVNFRLKVLDAEANGLDQEESFKQELAGYRDKLAGRYLLEREVSDKLVREAYDRSLKTINASHILILCNPQASAADSLIAFKKISDIREQALNGAPFDELAAKYSEEPRASDSKGSVGNFSVFQMVYPFESAAYHTPKGKVSEIVRTHFGYHIIKVNDAMPNPGQIEVAHIFIKTLPNASPADAMLARNTAFEIHKRVNSGDDFSAMALQYSFDSNSAKNGGILPLLSFGQAEKPFEDAAFALKLPGDISAPVQTSFGWHVIKLIRKVPLPTFEQVKSMLKGRVASNERSALSQEMFINRLKKEYHVKESVDYKNNKVLNDQLIELDKDPNGILFTINSNKVTVAEFADYISNHKSDEGVSDNSISQWYRDFMNTKLIGLENNHLEDHYPEFRFLMNEYRNGILLYNYSERKIWDYSQTDTAGLNRFFKSKMQVYRWKERANASVFVAGSAEQLVETKQLLKQNSSGKDILQKLNQTNPLNLVINQGVYQRGDHLFVDRANWANNTESEVVIGNAHVLVQIHEVIPARAKTMDEVRGEVLTDYQDFLEQEWIKELKQKYPVTINSKELKRLFR
jgi:peptidyl-prolyl cis-trans isomerase SurA